MKRHQLTIKVRQASNGQWYFVLVSGNNKVLMTSETYTRESNARAAARKISYRVIN